ncbi:MAG: hypothetical protein HOP28_01360 [Gemmatimonadales bacterium]|nr:hypothetical protein [Gemmatimonadales bacterium]
MPRSRLTVLALLLATAGACTRETTPEQALARTLEAEYGGGTRASVGFLNNATHLMVLLQGPRFANLSGSLVSSTALDVGRFALLKYGQSDQLDSLTVSFVEFTGRGSSYINAQRFDFSAAELR